MEIKTKFNVGDEVCLIWANRAVYKRIHSINIKITNFNNVYIKYTFMENNTPEINTCYFEVDESRCFSTKEELLKSL